MPAPEPLYRVLLIEGSSADVFLLETSAEMLRLPLVLETAEDGVLGPEKLGQELQHGPLAQVVVHDLNHPRLNGFELLEILSLTKPHPTGEPTQLLGQLVSWP